MSTLDDYRPLDLDAWRNAGGSALAPQLPSPFGDRALRGLPFSLGSSPDRCLIAFGAGFRTEPLAIPIGAAARTVIVAHRLLGAPMHEEPMGTVAARYTFRFTSGASEVIPIRARFEISRPGLSMRPAARALEDSPFRPFASRLCGPYRDAGLRMVDHEVPRSTLLLWHWRVPRPEDPLRELVIEPGTIAFAIAGITIGMLDEDPIVPAEARPVIVEIRDADAEGVPFDLTVSIDRGYASAAYPVQPVVGDPYLASTHVGFGLPGAPGMPSVDPPVAQRSASSRSYVHVAAVPSATLAVQRGDVVVAEVPWRELERGPVERERASVRIVDPGRGWVRTTIVDDSTGAPIAARVHFRAPDGIPYQPHGHHDEVNRGVGNEFTLAIGGDLSLGDSSYAYVDGHCEGWLPRGTVHVDVAQGFEYEPLRTAVDIGAGQRELTLRLRRWSDLAAAGWFAGDTHVHFLSPHGALLEARAEGLSVVNLLATQWGRLFTNVADFTGEPLCSRDGQTVVAVSQENRQHALGHLSLLGLRRAVYPLGSDGPDEAELGGPLETTLSHWADEARAQGATVVMPHAPLPDGEPATLVATGRADAFEVTGVRDGVPGLAAEPHRDYYAFLNAGYRLPLVGGTDKSSAHTAVGQMRTYVRIPDEPFSFEAWCRNLRAGRTFLSSGPLLTLTVDGVAIGDTLDLPAEGANVEVVATAGSILPVERLEIVMAGDVVAASDAVERRGLVHRLSIHTRLRITRSTWIAARTGAHNYFTPVLHSDLWRIGIKAHTSPVYVACGGPWRLFDEAATRDMLAHIDFGLAHLRTMRLRERPHSATHRHGETDHQAYLERPFHEARAALERRLRERA